MFPARYPRRRHAATRRGFSLTELAIVLAIGGIIIAAIWLFIGPVMDSAKRSTLQTEITTVVTNMRSASTGIANFSDGAAATVVPMLYNEGAIPAYMIRNPATGCSNTGSICADNPWGPAYTTAGSTDPNGSFQVCGWDLASGNNSKCGTGTSTTPFFAITVKGLNRNNCLSLATGTTGSTSGLGLIDIVLNGTSIVNLGHGLPVASSDAVAYCTLPYLQNIISYVYRMRSPG